MKIILIAVALVIAVAFSWPLIDQNTSDECAAANQKAAFRAKEAVRQIWTAEGADARTSAAAAAMVADAMTDTPPSYPKAAVLECTRAYWATTLKSDDQVRAEVANILVAHFNGLRQEGERQEGKPAEPDSTEQKRAEVCDQFVLRHLRTLHVICRG
jgi:hypothetical protein